jgi:hypothetical protein
MKIVLHLPKNCSSFGGWILANFLLCFNEKSLVNRTCLLLYVGLTFHRKEKHRKMFWEGLAMKHSSPLAPELHDIPNYIYIYIYNFFFVLLDVCTREIMLIIFTLFAIAEVKPSIVIRVPAGMKVLTCPSSKTIVKGISHVLA